MSIELLQITAAYSNAVLVAIMPHVSNYAKILDLPISQPVTISQVAHFGCSPLADHVGGRVVLTNNYSFSFDRGAVVLFRSPLSFYSAQDPDRIAEFFGHVKVTKNDAAKIARVALNKLGYTDEALHLGGTPKITPPPRNQGKTVARYLIEWLNPNKPDSVGGIPSERVSVEVDATTGQIQMIGIQNKNVRRPDPKINVQAPIQRPRPQSQPIGGTRMEKFSDVSGRAFLVAILPDLTEYVKLTGVEVKTPITTNDVDISHYYCGMVRNDPTAFVYLNTGDRFVYQHGHVTDFAAHDSYRIPKPNKAFEDKPPELFFGRVNTSADEALTVVRKAFKKLGYEAKVNQLQKRPEIVSPAKYGTNYFARYFFNWWPEDGRMQIAVAEVDATTGKIKALGTTDQSTRNLWREPPKCDFHFLDN